MNQIDVSFSRASIVTRDLFVGAKFEEVLWIIRSIVPLFNALGYALLYKKAQWCYQNIFEFSLLLTIHPSIYFYTLHIKSSAKLEIVTGIVVWKKSTISFYPESLT